MQISSGSAHAVRLTRPKLYNNVKGKQNRNTIHCMINIWLLSCFEIYVVSEKELHNDIKSLEKRTMNNNLSRKMYNSKEVYGVMVKKSSKLALVLCANNKGEL